jgi:hypothetical protein
VTQTFLTPLFELLLRGGTADRGSAALYLPVFAAGCAVRALLVLFLDMRVCDTWQVVLALPSRARPLGHCGRMMPTAAGIVGMIGLAIDVLQPSRSACIAVGIAWPSLMTVLMGVPETRYDDPDEDDDPEPAEELIG